MFTVSGAGSDLNLISLLHFPPTRDCQTDPTCCLCMDCFEHSEHKTHKYRVSSHHLAVLLERLYNCLGVGRCVELYGTR